MSVNIRYRCWEAEPNRQMWPSMLAQWLGMSSDQLSQAVAILCGERDPTPAQIDLLAAQLALDPQDLMFGNLVTQRGPNEVLKQNVIRLLDGRGEINQNQLAETLDVAPATLTRWRKGVVPDKSAKEALVKYFGLSGLEELEKRPLFLSYTPVTHAERVAWLVEHIRKLRPRDLQELFPALMRLLDVF
ncbi:hypothetical protein [Aquabacterium sp.]|uniref:hypothetical protein n=1 Tax=Aquabacterium sp. TaxID=1872578 RepID=UPI003BB20C09